jgi:hypothetical protein
MTTLHAPADFLDQQAFNSGELADDARCEAAARWADNYRAGLAQREAERDRREVRDSLDSLDRDVDLLVNLLIDQRTITGQYFPKSTANDIANTRRRIVERLERTARAMVAVLA